MLRVLEKNNKNSLLIDLFSIFAVTIILLLLIKRLLNSLLNNLKIC